MTVPILTRRGSLALIAAMAVSACGGATRPVLKVGSQRGGTKALMLSSGALDGASYTVEWSEFPAAQNLLEAVGAGAIDVGLAGDAPFQFAYQSGSPIKAISAQSTLPTPREALAIVVPAQSAVRSLADLRGKRVATTRGSIGHYLVLRALDAAKLPFDAVRITFLSPSDAKAAFSSGAVDAWSVWVPYLSAAIGEGARVVVDEHDLFRGYGFEVAGDQAIAAKRDLLRDFVKREGTALEWAAAHPDAYAQVLARETGLPPDVARLMVEKSLRRAVPIDDRLVADQRTVFDTFRRAGEAAGSRPLEEAFVRTL